MLSLRKLPVAINICSKTLIQRLTSDFSITQCEDVDLKEAGNILVQTVNFVTTIGINRPDKKNCLDIATAADLSNAINEFENSDDTVVGVLHGLGGNFCAGHDLAEIIKYGEENRDIMPQFDELAKQIGVCKKPLIAAISGYAVGLGFELALMCDLRVVEETAIMGFFNRRFGIPILSGGTVRLPRMIGYSRAMDLILTGRAISADDALQWGLANQYSACGSALGSAVNFARSLVKFPQKTLVADRASVYNATYSAKTMDEALEFEKKSSYLVLEEGVEQAKRFYAEGIGRHGKFHNLKPIDTSLAPLDESLL